MLYGLSLTDTHVGARTRVATRSVGLISGDAKEEQKSGVSHTIRSPKPHSFRLPMRWGADLRAAAGQFFLGCLRRHLGLCLAASVARAALALLLQLLTCALPPSSGLDDAAGACSAVALLLQRRIAARLAARSALQELLHNAAAAAPAPPAQLAGLAPRLGQRRLRAGLPAAQHTERLSHKHIRGNAKLALTPGRFVVLSSSVVRHSTSTVERRAHATQSGAHAASHPRPEPRRACVLRALQRCAAPVAGARPRGVVAAALSTSPAKTPDGCGGTPGGRQG